MLETFINYLSKMIQNVVQNTSNIFRQLFFTGSITLQYYALWIFCSSKRSPLVIPMTITSYNFYVALPFLFLGITSMHVRPPFLLGCQISAELSTQHRIPCLTFSGNHLQSWLPFSCGAMKALTNKKSVLWHNYSVFKTYSMLNILNSHRLGFHFSGKYSLLN